MNVEQVFNIVNTATSELIGTAEVTAEDTSKVVSRAQEAMNLKGMDNFTKKLVDHIGKVIFVDRPYTGNYRNLMMDGWEFGSVLEKISYDELPTATENKSWDLQDQQSYDVNIFTQPKVSALFFNDKTTFEVPMSFTERQVKSAFDNISQVNALLSLIENTIEKSLTVKNEALAGMTVNTMIAEVIKTANVNRAVNLLSLYKKFNTTATCTATNCLFDEGFLRFSSYMISVYSRRFTQISTLFNEGGKERFTATDLQSLVLLADFHSAAEYFLYSTTFNEQYNKLPNATTVPFWQGSGTTYDLTSTSKINITLPVKGGVEQSGILGVLHDRYACGINNFDRRVTTNYNGKAEFINHWYKVDAQYFIDLNENFVVFYVSDGEA